MQLTSLLVLGSALGAMAAPSGHSHLHRSIHERNVFYKGVHSSKPATTTTTSTTAAAATTASASPASVSSAAASSSGNASAPAFCSGASKLKRATEAEIDMVGNIGVSGQYGCNMMVVDNSVADQYEYTAQFTNVDTQEYEVVGGLKIGPTGEVNGFFTSVLNFNLSPGETVTIAYEANTQGFAAFAPGSVPKTSYGEWAGTWVEVDFADSANSGWSGADCSSLVSASAGLSIPGCQVCDASDSSSCSTIYEGGQGVNAFVAGTANDDGLGINKTPGPLKLDVKVGYQGS